MSTIVFVMTTGADEGGQVVIGGYVARVATSRTQGPMPGRRTRLGRRRIGDQRADFRPPTATSGGGIGVRARLTTRRRSKASLACDSATSSSASSSTSHRARPDEQRQHRRDVAPGRIRIPSPHQPVAKVSTPSRTDLAAAEGEATEPGTAEVVVEKVPVGGPGSRDAGTLRAPDGPRARAAAPRDRPRPAPANGGADRLAPSTRLEAGGNFAGCRDVAACR